MKISTRSLSRKFLLSLIALGLSSACQKKETVNDKSVDANGNCTLSYVQDYNKIVATTVALEGAFSQTPIDEIGLPEKINNLKMACAVMIQEHKDMNCYAKAANASQGQAATFIRYEDLRPNCSGVLKQIQDNKTAGKPVATKPFSGKEVKQQVILTEDPAYLIDEN